MSTENEQVLQKDAVGLYDDAIVTSFRKLLRDQTISIIPPENAIRFAAQVRKDKANLPIVSLNRLGFSIKLDEINQKARNIGSFVTRNGNNENIFAQVIPIRIEYQIDVFTVDRVTCDAICRELIFYMIQHPTLQVTVPYGLDIKHDFNLFLDSDVVDNSDTIEHTEKGVKFRYTLTFYCDDAYLFRQYSQKQAEIVASVGTIPKQ